VSPSFTGVVIVAAVAFAVPLLLALAPRLHVPAGALELAAGIAIGPAALGWVEPDTAISVLAALGLAFLLFLAGLDVAALVGMGDRVLRGAGVAFLASAALAVAAGLALQGTGLVRSWAFAAIVLSGTHLAAVATLVHDARIADSEVGRQTLAGAAVANVAAVGLLSLHSADHAGEAGARLLLIGALALAAATVIVAARGLARWHRLTAAVMAQGDTSAQVRVRGAFVLLAGFVALGETLGVEAVLAAFAAGLVLGLIDRDAVRNHPQLRVKLDGAGHGFFIPVFLVAAGLSFDLDGLLDSPRHLALAPVFLACLLLVRGLPALLYRPRLGPRGALAAGLMQSISLPLIVVAARVGEEMGTLDPRAGAAMIAGGLASYVVLPEAAKAVLRGPTAGAPARS
jgi:Kef-type K+ transport system membrane component KefB